MSCCICCAVLCDGMSYGVLAVSAFILFRLAQRAARAGLSDPQLQEMREIVLAMPLIDVRSVGIGSH